MESFDSFEWNTNSSPSDFLFQNRILLITLMQMNGKERMSDIWISGTFHFTEIIRIIRKWNQDAI